MSAMFWNFCVGKHRYSASTYDVTKSYLLHSWDKKIRNGYLIGNKGYYAINGQSYTS